MTPTTMPPSAMRRASLCVPPTARVTLRVSLLGLLLSTVACSAGESDHSASLVTIDTLPGGIVRTMTSAPVDSGQWQLVPLVTIQPAEGAPGELMSPSDVVLTETSAVLVAESRPNEVKMYDAAGAYVRTIGGEGAGPGEFRSAWLAVHGDTLLVQDPQLSRASTFLLTDGVLLATHPTTGRYWAPLGVDGGNRAVIRMLSDDSDSTGVSSQRFLRIGFSGTPVDTVAVRQRSTNEEEERWFVREPQLNFSVTAAEKRALVEQKVVDMTTGPVAPPRLVLEAAFELSKIPDVRPPFESFAIDAAGRTWVRRTVSDSGYVTFDLFGADRRWLDIVRVPASAWPETTWASVSWGRDRVAVYVEDELGRPAVHVYAVRRSGQPQAVNPW